MTTNFHFDLDIGNFHDVVAVTIGKRLIGITTKSGVIHQIPYVPAQGMPNPQGAFGRSRGKLKSVAHFLNLTGVQGITVEPDPATANDPTLNCKILTINTGVVSLKWCLFLA